MVSYFTFPLCYVVFWCGVADISRLVMVACRQVLVRRQTGYGSVISWLEEEMRKISGRKGVDVEILVGVVRELSGKSQSVKV